MQSHTLEPPPQATSTSSAFAACGQRAPDDSVAAWLVRHREALSAAEARGLDEGRGRVTCFLEVARDAPIGGMTPETLAAAAVTADYQRDPSRLAELLRTLHRAEDAKAHAYARRPLLELLQNAEDAQKGREPGAEVRLSAEIVDGRVWVDVSYDGRPFDAPDVDAFRAMHHSTKQGDASTIGEFGVGIKVLVSCADVVELHSGGFHLRFMEGTRDEPFFLLPRATSPRSTTHEVHLRFRWREHVSPEAALAVLVGDVGPEHFLFLEKVRAIRLPDRVIGLLPQQSRGPFAVFTEIDCPSEERWLLGKPESAAVAVRVVRNGSEVRVQPPEHRPSLAAFFPIFKQPSGVGAWLHARLPLSDDRESLALSKPDDRRRVAQCLDVLAGLMAELPRALATEGARVEQIPEVVLGPAEGVEAAMIAPHVADDEGALARGVLPTEMLLRKIVRDLAGKAWVPARDGRSVLAPHDVWFGAADHDLWQPAVGSRAELPPPESSVWIAKAPISKLGIPKAGWPQFELAMADRRGASLGQRLCVDLAGPGSGAATARLALALAAGHSDMQHLTTFPVVVAGSALGELLVDLSAPNNASADVTTLGLCTLDDTAYRGLNAREKTNFESFLRNMGAIPTRPGGLLAAVSRRTADAGHPALLEPALRVAMRALQLRNRSALTAAELFTDLFKTAGPRPLDLESDVTVSVALARVRVPMLDGTWRPLGHGTVGEIAGVPATARIDCAAMARLLGVSIAEATNTAVAAGAWSGVPIAIWYALPLAGSDGPAEHARFAREAPAGLGDLYARLRKLLPGSGGRPRVWPDLPGAETRSATGSEIPAAGGFPDGASGHLRILAQADLPEGLAPEALEGLARSGRWLPFASVPIWHDAATHRARNAAIAPGGWFPSMLTLRLRSAVQFTMLPSPAERPGPGRFRITDYPRGNTPRSGLTRLPLVDTSVVDTWPANVLDALHIVALDATEDPRHVLRALVYLRETLPTSPFLAEAPHAAALLAAHRDVWDWLVSALKRRGGKHEDLRAACIDAARLGWIPEEMADPGLLPMLVDCQSSREWRTVAGCRLPNAEACAFYDAEGGTTGWRLSPNLAFVALRRGNDALAKVLNIPVFSLEEPTYDTLELEPGARDWLVTLVAGLAHPFLEHVMTEHAPGGGQPMSVERFATRAADAGLAMPRVLGVRAWPTHAVLADPAKGHIRIEQPAHAPFRFAAEVEHADRRGPAFLVDATLAADRSALESARWRLDIPLAEALESRVHAPMIQNLLRALDPENVGRLDRDPALAAVIGRELFGSVNHPPSAIPAASEDATALLERVFRRVRVRAAALVLCHGDTETTLFDDADRRWTETTTLHRLRNAALQAPNLATVLRDVLRVEVPTDAAFDAMADAIVAAAGHHDLDVIEARLEAAMRRKVWRGTEYNEPEELDALLQSEAAALPLAEAAAGQAVPPGRPSGRAGFAGGGRFSSRAHPIGRLGEHLARRWAVQYLAGGDPRRVVDVSTTEARVRARAEGLMPSDYAAGPADVSPGVDLLVFSDDPTVGPLGIEVKSRAGEGAIAFEWTRNERERCQRTLESRPDDWPMADYRGLVISNLLDEPAAPTFVLLAASALMEGADPTRFTVRAQV